jgi:hypothetical protein
MDKSISVKVAVVQAGECKTLVRARNRDKRSLTCHRVERADGRLPRSTPLKGPLGASDEEV